MSSYKPEEGEVFYCGQCKRQQQPSEGIKCKICGKTTVSWYTLREGHEAAQARWERINGKPKRP
ncbi:MAG: hypothetical protein CUN55_00165 [Phototrophicales bacterium]|nr:MAG: hypothetical protein CUN55_00165 [Phototrophicales bacterium]